jgi:hypothetical protein
MAGRREAELILCCAAAALNPERPDSVGAVITAEVDWHLVMCVALRQGVLPLVYRALTPTLAPQMPAVVLDRMRSEFHGNSLRNLHLAAELVRLCRMLEEHCVNSLAVKRPALAAGVYGDLKLRQFTDLDLLVRERDLPAALAALKADGFHPVKRLRKGARGVAGAHEVTLARRQSLCAIDLHWRLSPPYFAFTPEGEELWARATEVDLGPGRVFTLGHEDLMLYLCAHGAKHGWQSLSGVCDVAAAAHTYNYDWEALAARAKVLGGRRTLLLGGLLAHDLLGAAIPGTVITAARGEPAVACAARIFCHYFHRLEVNGPGLFQRWSIPLGMIPGGGARFRYTLARTFLPAAADWELVSLPQVLFPLYYVLRPVRLAWQKGPELMRQKKS